MAIVASFAVHMVSVPVWDDVGVGGGDVKKPNGKVSDRMASLPFPPNLIPPLPVYASTYMLKISDKDSVTVFPSVDTQVCISLTIL